MLDDDEQGEIRAVSAAVLYDGQISVMLDVPGHDELVEHAIQGDAWTVLLTHHGQSLPIDMGGATATDRRCPELVRRGVRRLNEDMDRQRERMGRHRDEWMDGDHVAR